MHCQADHLNFSLKLDLTPGGISIFEPFHSYYCTILKIAFVDIAETTLANQVLAAEVVCSNL